MQTALLETQGIVAQGIWTQAISNQAIRFELMISLRDQYNLQKPLRHVTNFIRGCACRYAVSSLWQTMQIDLVNDVLKSAVCMC